MNRTIFLRRNVNVFYINSFLLRALFFLPILALFFQDILKSLFLVGIIIAARRFSSVIFEIPTGVLADKYGRKRILVIGYATLLFGFLFVALGNYFYTFIIGAVIWGLGEAFISGVEESIVYDSLKEIKEETRFKKVMSRVGIIENLGPAFGMMLGGFLASYSFRLAMVSTIPIILFSLITSLYYIEPYYRKSKKSMAYHTKESFSFILNNKQLLILLSFSLIVFGAGGAVHSMKEVFYSFVGIPIYLLGIIGSAAFFIRAIGSLASPYISDKLGDKKTLVIMESINFVMFFLATVILGWISVVLMVTKDIFRGVNNPVIRHLMNKEINPTYRTTILSIENFLVSLGSVIFTLILGYIANLSNITIAFRIFSFFSLFGVVLWLLLRGDK